MNLEPGAEESRILVGKETGRTSRTKYFVRGGDLPPQREPANGGSPTRREPANGGSPTRREPANGGSPTRREPANGGSPTRQVGFVLPEPAARGSSDCAQPGVPSPGDIRRMFGNDKIDCQPEYTRSMDPDWSSVRPTTPAELQNSINEWHEKTNQTLRNYHDTEEKRKKFEKNKKLSTCDRRPHSVGMISTRKELKYGGKRLNSADAYTPVSNESKRKRRDLRSGNKVPITVNKSKIDRKRSTENFQNVFIDAMGMKQKEIGRITFTPSKIKINSYNTAINVLQKMKSDHWIIIDMLYNDIQREKGVEFEYLHKCVRKILDEIFGIETEFILSTIHPDPIQRVVKLGKLMLNVYHEAMFGRRTKKRQQLAVPGINNPNFIQRCIEIYTTCSPSKMRSTRMTSKMYENLTNSDKRPPKCIACYLKKREKEEPVKRIKKEPRTKLGVFKIWNYNNQFAKKQIARKIKPNGLGAVKLMKDNFYKEKRTNSSKLSRKHCTKIENNTKVISGKEGGSKAYYGPPVIQISEGTDAGGFLDFVTDKSYEDEDGSESTDIRDETESGISDLQSQLVGQPRELRPRKTTTSREAERCGKKTCGQSVEESDQGGKKSFEGGGDSSLVKYSNDYNYYLSSLYESSSKISLELSEKIDSSSLFSSLLPANERENDRFFSSTTNILQLNNLLEKMLLREDVLTGSRTNGRFKTANESYYDCEVLPYETRHQFNEEKHYKYFKWMRLTAECVCYKGYITFFMTFMLGLVTAFFYRGSFLNQMQTNPTIKNSVKQVIKTFLMGALRLVDGF